jgi:hypothetical protein
MGGALPAEHRLLFLEAFSAAMTAVNLVASFDGLKDIVWP